VRINKEPAWRDADYDRSNQQYADEIIREVRKAIEALQLVEA
jgi:hypothetical protein